MWQQGTHPGTSHWLCLQGDGNLVEHALVNGVDTVMWSIGYSGPIGTYHMTLQSDGNLVDFNSSNTVVWNIGLGARPNNLENMSATWGNRYPANQLSVYPYKGWFSGCASCLAHDGFYTLSGNTPIVNDNPGWYFVGHDDATIFQPLHYAAVGDNIWFWEPNGTLHVWIITHIRNDVPYTSLLLPGYSDTAVEFQTCMDYSADYDEIVDARLA